MRLALALTGNLSLTRRSTSFNYYVDSVSGSDSNDGTSEAAAFETLAAAITASSTGETIGLKAGQYHLRGTSASIADRSLGKYGSGADPILDARQHLDGATWTNTSGNVWETDITLGQTSVVNGVNSNTFNPGVWLDETFLDWKVGGADIAANIALVEADPGSFTIHRTGSTTQDPRSDSASTTYTIYVQLADSSDPNGQDVSVTSYQSVATCQGGTHRNIIFKGAHGKDSIGVIDYTGDVPTLASCSSIDFGEHGWVGPVNIVGTFTARGKPRPGTMGYSVGRANGAAVNLYSNTNRSTLDLSIGTIDAQDCSIALYGHGSGNQCYRDVTVSSIVCDNCTKVVAMNPVPTTLLPMCAGTLTVSNITATDVDEALEIDGEWVIGGGSVTWATTNINTTRQRFASFVGTAPTLSVSDTDLEFTLEVTAGKSRTLIHRETSSSHTAPAITLSNVQDNSAADKVGRLSRGGTDNIWSKTAITLSGASSIGDLMDQATGTNYPESLTVGAGCTFGMGDRTGDDIETALTGASITHSIDHDTTIINRAGTTLSSPGW